MTSQFRIIVLVVALFIGYMLGYSVPPFIQSGAFSERENKGVKVQIDQKLEDYYKDLYKEEE